MRSSEDRKSSATPRTKCSALLQLKLTSSDLSCKDIKEAQGKRLQDIQEQVKACQDMIRIHKGAKEEEICTKKLKKLEQDKEKVLEAAKFLMNVLRIDQLTSDMSWRPGVPLKVEDSLWQSSVKPKTRTIAIINTVFHYVPGKTPTKGRRRSRRSSSISVQF